jgi:hypothetical protein
MTPVELVSEGRPPINLIVPSASTDSTFAIQGVIESCTDIFTGSEKISKKFYAKK